MAKKAVEENEFFEEEFETKEDEEMTEVTVIQKPGFGEKVKTGLKKAKDSKVVKVIGGLGLVALGVGGALLFKNRESDDDFMEVIDLDSDDFTEVNSETAE